MKICPVCQTEFKDGTMRFCTKDGTPLVAVVPPAAEEPQSTPLTLTPTSTAPSVPEPPSLDATLSDIPVSSNQYVDKPNFDPAVRLDSDLDSELDFQTVEESKKIGVPVNQWQPVEPAVAPPASSRTKPAAVAPTAAVETPTKQPKRKSNVAMFAILGALGLFGVLGIIAAAGGYWYYSSVNNQVADTNANANIENSNSVEMDDDSSDINNSTDMNLNVNENSNLDFGDNIDANIDIIGLENINANTRPSPSPRVSPSPSPRNSNRNVNQIVEIGPSQPSPTPVIRQIPPSPTQQPQQGSKTVAGGVVNGKASSLPKPPYPASARAVRAEGQVNVQVLIDENGNVVSASAISGNPLLRQAAAQAARQAKFPPTILSGQPVRVSGVIIYNFTMN